MSCVSIRVVVVAILLIRGALASGNSAILVACPDALATLYCATKDQWLTVQVNGTGGPFVTIEQRDCLNGCTRNLTLCEGSVATVNVTVTAETIVMSIKFIARSSLNGTALLCYSIADGEARDTNSSLIAIVGPPQTTPTNLTLNSTTCTFAWQGISDEKGGGGGGNVFYECTVMFPEGRNITTKVTEGKYSLRYNAEICSAFGHARFAVRAVNCAGMGPSAIHISNSPPNTVDDQAMKLTVSKASEIVPAAVCVLFGIASIVIVIIIVIIYKYKKKNEKSELLNKRSGESQQGGINAQPQYDALNHQKNVILQVEADGGAANGYVETDGGAASGYVETDGGAVKESISANLDDTERDQYKPKKARLRIRV
ncbi:hypothetical protein EMCRGX_G015523 [Ephydatia muelleri]